MTPMLKRIFEVSEIFSKSLRASSNSLLSYRARADTHDSISYKASMVSRLCFGLPLCRSSGFRIAVVGLRRMAELTCFNDMLSPAKNDQMRMTGKSISNDCCAGRPSLLLLLFARMLREMFAERVSWGNCADLREGKAKAMIQTGPDWQ